MGFSRQEYWNGLPFPSPGEKPMGCNSFHLNITLGLPWWLSGKESACQWKRHRFDPWVGKIPWRRKWQPIPVFLPGESHRQRSLVGDSPWNPRVGHYWSDRAHTHSSCLKTVGVYAVPCPTPPFYLPPIPVSLPYCAQIMHKHCCISVTFLDRDH